MARVGVAGANDGGDVVAWRKACRVERIWSWLARGGSGIWDSVFVVVGRVALGCGGVGALSCGVSGDLRLVLRDMGKPIQITARLFALGDGAWGSVGGIGVVARVGLYRFRVEWAWCGISSNAGHGAGGRCFWGRGAFGADRVCAIGVCAMHGAGGVESWNLAGRQSSAARGSLVGHRCVRSVWIFADSDRKKPRVPFAQGLAGTDQHPAGCGAGVVGAACGAHGLRGGNAQGSRDDQDR